MPTAPLSGYQWQETEAIYNSSSLYHQSEPRQPQRQQQPMPDSERPAQITIDPSLATSWPAYYPYHASHVPAEHLLHRPPSQGSSQAPESPQSQLDPQAGGSTYTMHNSNGKRTANNSSTSNGRKKQRQTGQDDDDLTDAHSPTMEKDEKSKPTRGSRACTVCRRLKMKCVGAENGSPCKRCITGNHECVFEESNRGKRSSNQQVKKHELLTRSLRKMERTLDTVLRSISHPGATANQTASAISSRPTSPTTQAVATQALLASPSPPPTSSYHPPSSPKLHSLPDNSLNPLGLLAEASLANRKAIKAAARPDSANSPSNSHTLSSQKIGVANDGYFKPGPMTILPLRRLYIERQVQPEMLSFISTQEVIDLFEVYFEHLNPHCGLLLPEFHTPSLVCSRSPFLLTTICAISAKFCPQNPDLHGRLNALAKQLSFSVPEKGYKSVEIVQAYLLLTLWGAGHTETYEQEKTWLLLGMAIRTATDLNLHRKTAVTSSDSPEGRIREREVRNRERTWLMCFVLDRSISAQMGKPHSIKEDNIVRTASQWWQNPSAAPKDSGICAYVELQRIMSRSLDFLYSGTSSVSGLQIDCDYLVVTKTIEAQLQAWHSEWQNHRSLQPSLQERNLNYRRLIAKFYFNYALLVVNSFGLQNAMDRSPVDVGHFFARCHTAASTLAILVRDDIGPQGFLRYSPDSHFVQISYAILTLLKLVRSEFRLYMENEAKTISLVVDIATLLGEIAVGPQHTPALYSAFLKALVSAKETQTASSGVSPRATPLGHLHQSKIAAAQREPEFTMNNSEGTRLTAFSQSSSADATLGGPEFQFIGEMGPVADISTFPPTMMTPKSVEDENINMLSMDSILSANFWDSVLIPGYSNSFEGLSGGMVYGAGGSGLITPRVGTPNPTGSSLNTRGDLNFQHLQTAVDSEA